MNEEEIRRLRINILRQLKAVTPRSLGISALMVGATLEAFTVTQRDIEAECKHLADPAVGMVRVIDDKFSRSVKRYEITADGREWLAEEGF